jgi:hypothetical protein
LLAERYGGTPFTYERCGAQERERLLEFLRVESEVAAAYADMGPNDDVVFVDEE